LRGSGVVIDDDEIKLSVKTRNEFPCFAVSVKSPQNMLGRCGNIVLNEILINARILVYQVVEELDVRSAKIFRYGGRLDD
jgi:hypothetical protein